MMALQHVFFSFQRSQLPCGYVLESGGVCRCVWFNVWVKCCVKDLLVAGVTDGIMAGITVPCRKTVNSSHVTMRRGPCRSLKTLQRYKKMTTGKRYTNKSYHGNPQPSFLGVITHILEFKTFIFHRFGVSTPLKNISQIGNLPQFSGWKSKIFELPPPSNKS